MENYMGEGVPEMAQLVDDFDDTPEIPQGIEGLGELVPSMVVGDEGHVEIVGGAPERVKLFSALSAYFEEVVNPENVANNTFLKSKYAPLGEVLNTVRPVMGKHGLSLIQVPQVLDSGDVSVQTIITHSAGAYISFPSLKGKPTKQDIQGVGAVITYLRRFAVNAITGVAGEVDDDGNAASGNVKKTSGGAKAKKEENPLRSELITECSAYVQNDSKKRAEVTKALKAVVPSGNVNNITKDEDYKKAIEIVKGLK